MAGMFDALMFLAVASVVSVTLLAAFGERTSAGDDRHEMVEDAHLVLLRSTAVGPDGNPHSVQELFVTAVCGDDVTKGKVHRTLELLLPGWDWCWSVHRGGSVVVEVYHGRSGVGESIYCSIVRTSYQDEQIEYRLEAWSN